MEYLILLRQPNFLRLWLAQILSQVGQNLLNFSLIIVVFDLAQGSRFANLSVALLVIAFGLPALLFASIAGSYVDLWDRKKVLVASNLIRAGLVLLYPFAAHSLWLILLLSFLISTVLQFFVPAETATIPKLVFKKSLLSANSVFIFTIYAAFIVGYSASGPVVALFGNHGPYVVVAVMMFLAGLFSATLPAQPATKAATERPRTQIWQHMQENWRLVTSHRERYFSIWQLTITQAVVSVLITLAPALSLALLHIPLQQASHILIIPVGIGMVLGVMLVGSVTRDRAKTTVIQTCLVIAAITLTMVGLSGQLYRIYQGNTVVPVASISLIVGTLMLMLGLLNALISATAQTMLQESTTDDNRGKVFASLNMMINLAATAPILVAGLLSAVLSVTKVIALLGAALTVYALWVSWHYRVDQKGPAN
jgi:MFS family permease